MHNTVAKRRAKLSSFRVSLVPITRACRQFSGLARTVRGSGMSATPGKAFIDGIAEVTVGRVFVMRFLQGRNPDWVNRVSFAKFSLHACWLDDLEPVFDEDRFFYETEVVQLQEQK